MRPSAGRVGSVGVTRFVMRRGVGVCRRILLHLFWKPMVASGRRLRLWSSGLRTFGLRRLACLSRRRFSAGTPPSPSRSSARTAGSSRASPLRPVVGRPLRDGRVTWIWPWRKLVAFPSRVCCLRVLGARCRLRLGGGCDGVRGLSLRGRCSRVRCARRCMRGGIGCDRFCCGHPLFARSGIVAPLCRTVPLLPFSFVAVVPFLSGSFSFSCSSRDSASRYVLSWTLLRSSLVQEWSWFRAFLAFRARAYRD